MTEQRAYEIEECCSVIDKIIKDADGKSNVDVDALESEASIVFDVKLDFLKQLRTGN